MGVRRCPDHPANLRFYPLRSAVVRFGIVHTAEVGSSSLPSPTDITPGRRPFPRCGARSSSSGHRAGIARPLPQFGATSGPVRAREEVSSRVSISFRDGRREVPSTGGFLAVDVAGCPDAASSCRLAPGRWLSLPRDSPGSERLGRDQIYRLSECRCEVRGLQTRGSASPRCFNSPPGRLGRDAVWAGGEQPYGGLVSCR